ncbi:MAG: anti-virulence regulator CigR family protein [Pseudohongiellaceae bacterium]
MKQRSLTRGMALCGSLVLLSACADLGVSGPTSVYSPAGNSVMRNSLAAEVIVNITAGEARRIATANNLTGRRALPPGIQRNLARGKPLPPGIARQMVPQSMLTALPVYPDHEWRIAGDDLVLVALGTQLVVELLNDVFR